ncbi:MAG: purine-nucleoside phosphorylase [Myxococcota bacterium]
MNPHPEVDQVTKAAEALEAALGPAPPLAIVLGSGLGAVVDRFENPTSLPSTEVNFPQSTVSGHAGRLVRGTLGGTEVVAVSGRVHLYEGLPLDLVVRGVRALHRWGVRRIVFTASVGGITEGLDPGELMLVRDHINLQGRNPLTGPAYGTRFPDLTEAYDPQLCDILLDSADATGIQLHEGVYAAMPGPSYETPAEIRMLRTLGADVVGMSTVPEVIAANEIGFAAAAIAVVSNRAAGLSGGPLTHDEVTESAHNVAVGLAALFAHAAPRLAE